LIELVDYARLFAGTVVSGEFETCGPIDLSIKGAKLTAIVRRYPATREQGEIWVSESIPAPDNLWSPEK
jgi:hypothetical protein